MHRTLKIRLVACTMVLLCLACVPAPGFAQLSRRLGFSDGRPVPTRAVFPAGQRQVRTQPRQQRASAGRAQTSPRKQSRKTSGGQIVPGVPGVLQASAEELVLDDAGLADSGGCCGGGTCVDVGCCGGGGCGDCGGCGGGACNAPSCMSCQFANCLPLCGSLFGCPRFNFEQLSLRLGVQAFKGGANRGQSASFGFHEGLQWGFPVYGYRCHGIGGQFGFRATQNNFSGSAFTDDSRNQFFITTGLFRRADEGLQGALAVDYLREDWYFKGEVGQVRGELSLAMRGVRDFGIRFAAKSSDDSTLSLVDSDVDLDIWEIEDHYSIFLKQRLIPGCSNEWTIMVGGTRSGRAFFGGDSFVPLASNTGLMTTFRYFGSDGDDDLEESQTEAWNVGISWVWYPRACRGGMRQSYFHPMVPLADNGTMVLRRL